MLVVTVMRKNEIEKVKGCVFLEPDDARAFAVLAAQSGCSRSELLSGWLRGEFVEDEGSD